jgi:hypothetical protein
VGTRLFARGLLDLLLKIENYSIGTYAT